MMVRTMGRNDAGGGSGGGGGGGMGAATPIAAPGLVKMVMFLRALYLHTCTRTKLAHTTDAGAGQGAHTKAGGAHRKHDRSGDHAHARHAPHLLQHSAAECLRTHTRTRSAGHSTGRGEGARQDVEAVWPKHSGVMHHNAMARHSSEGRGGAQAGRQAGRQAACGHGLAS
jgi:hypothetical protein